MVNWNLNSQKRIGFVSFSFNIWYTYIFSVVYQIHFKRLMNLTKDGDSSNLDFSNFKFRPHQRVDCECKANLVML